MVGGRSHQSRTLTFGLGASQTVSKVGVDWPWGRVTEVGNVSANNTIVLSDIEATPERGRVYLAKDSSGATTIGPVSVHGTFDFYVLYEPNGAPLPQSIKRFETKIIYPSNVMLSSVEYLGTAADSDPSPGGFVVEYDQAVVCATTDPIPLMHLTALVTDEGADPTLRIDNVEAPSFSDPIVETVPCWWEDGTDVLYRFEDPGVSSPLNVQIDDTKAPVPVFAGVFADHRDWVALVFDEPIDDYLDDGRAIVDTTCYNVYNYSKPKDKRVVDWVWEFGDLGVVLGLSSVIQDGSTFHVAVDGIRDLHANVASPIDKPILNSDEGSGIDINEVMQGGQKSSSLEWVELRNGSAETICLNGWGVTDGSGLAYCYPDSPFVLVEPEGLSVLVIGGDELDESGEPIGLSAHVENTSVETDELVVIDAFGRIRDSVELDESGGLKAISSCSVQKVVDQSGRQLRWVQDAPEYRPGVRGTPGSTNRFGDGTLALEKVEVPAATKLLGAAPNPFNPETTITYSLARDQHLKMEVFDIRGRRVRVIVDEFRTATVRGEAVWNGRDDRGAQVASSVYFVRMVAGNSDPQILKIALVK